MRGVLRRFAGENRATAQYGGFQPRWRIQGGRGIPIKCWGVGLSRHLDWAEAKQAHDAMPRYNRREAATANS
jgi:hypothetical protein